LTTPLQQTYLPFGDFSGGTISANSDFAGEAETKLCKEQAAETGNISASPVASVIV
jgi:hypothetical protein